MAQVVKDELDELIKVHSCTSDRTWQKLRLLILERDHYICQRCGNKANSVHHKQYGPISSSDLISVCPVCHLKLHNLDPDLVNYKAFNRRDLDKAIQVLEKRIVEVEENLKGYVDGEIQPFLPLEQRYKYGISSREWGQACINLLSNRLREMREMLDQLKEEYGGKA